MSTNGILSGNVLGASPVGSALDTFNFLLNPPAYILGRTAASAYRTGRSAATAAQTAADTASAAAERVRSEIPITVEEKEDDEGVWGSDTALWIGLLVVGGLVVMKIYQDNKKNPAKVKSNRRHRRLRQPRSNMSTEQVPAWQAVRTETMPTHRGQVLIGASLQQKRDDYKHEGMEAADESIRSGHGASAKARDTAWAQRKKSIRSSLMTPRTIQLLEQSWKQGWDMRARSAGYVANREGENVRLVEGVPYYKFVVRFKTSGKRHKMTRWSLGYPWVREEVARELLDRFGDSVIPGSVTIQQAPRRSR